MSRPVYSLLRTDAYNAPLDDVQSSDEASSPSLRMPSSQAEQLNPMLSRGLYSLDSLRSDQVETSSDLNPASASDLPSALERNARDLKNRMSALSGGRKNYSSTELESLLSELKALQTHMEERKKIESDRIGYVVNGKGSGGVLGMISAIESEMADQWYHDKVLAVANTPYSLAHKLTHKWTGIGSYFNMDMFKEPVTSLSAEQKKRIDELHKEKDYRTSLVNSLSSSANELGSMISKIEELRGELGSGASPGRVAEISNRLRGHISGAMSFLERGALNGDKELKSSWDAARKNVNEGLKKLNEEADMAVATCQAVEKTVVIGGAITATAITGGAAAPLVGMAVGSASSVGMSGVHFLASGGKVDFEEEKAKILDDVKDSVLYSIGGGLSKIGMFEAAGKAAVSAAGRIVPSAVARHLTGLQSGVFGTSVGIFRRAATAMYYRTGGLLRNNFISHARTGMVVELPAAAWDTWRAQGTDILDPTGRLREMNIPESSLMLRYFTHRIGSAGVGGALGGCTMGMRNVIGGMPQAAPPLGGLLNPRTFFPTLSQTLRQQLNPRDFIRRRIADATAIPDLYAQSVLSVWSDYRLTGWFYGVDLDPTGEERSRMMRQAITSGMAGRFGTTALNQGMNAIGNRRVNELVTERNTLNNEMRNQAALAGRRFNREVVLASTPGSEHALQGAGLRRNTLAFQLDSRANIADTASMARNHIMSTAAHAMYSRGRNFTPFGVNLQRFRDSVSDAINNANPNLDSSRLIQERRGMGLSVARASERRASRLLVLRDQPTNDNIAYGRQYINDYINELPPAGGSPNLGFLRRASDQRRNPYGKHAIDLDSPVPARNNLDNTLVKDRLNLRAQTSNLLLRLENGARNGLIGRGIGMVANGLQASANYLGGYATAWITAPSASIYASYGVMIGAPATILAHGVSTLLTPVGGLGSAMRNAFGARRANPHELGELYAKIHEGKALRQWMDDMNGHRPGTFDAPDIAALDASIQRTEALLNQGNRARPLLLSRDRLTRRRTIPDSGVVMQNRVMNDLDALVGPEMMNAMRDNR